MTMADRIEVERLVVWRGGHTVVSDASFEVGPGLWLVRGANGSGKSTLLRALAGVLPTRGGTARICGHDLRRDATAARACLCYVPESAELFGYLTAREFLQTVAAFRGCAVERAAELFASLTSSDALPTRIASLSAGQRRKLLLSTTACGTPRVLLLDEPTNALDQEALAWLRVSLERWRDEDRVVLVAMHADPIAVRWDGRLMVEAGVVSSTPATAAS